MPPIGRVYQDHCTQEKDGFYFILAQSTEAKLRFPVKRHLGHSSSDLSSRPPEPHLSFTHTNRESGSIGPRNSFKYEELNACTREKEKIIELIRSNHLINLHADQFSRSIIGRCSSSEGVSGKTVTNAILCCVVYTKVLSPTDIYGIVMKIEQSFYLNEENNCLQR